ncbi:transcriptional regulator, CarD family [Peptoclostridium acidaminophilum DSM 3953]|uniref:Transcriptional regulator, CarD family n=1 Tax=Peptoclostridium acidaminophilum DSM 3953 TaxID=1286171 RepID=W8TIM0_PEPAC|nr:CarD family transcriptional regulator [Peptoclostridium acidaminophilum]AHM56057.1 transcriptional regulator, CarD family [Peptoclostridium acidaminophilum DSM 3953]
MFHINDYIMYGKTGVCQVTGIEKGKLIGNAEIEYYVLKPLSCDTTIKIPVNTTKVNMRPVVSKMEVLDFIDSMAEEDTVWIKDDRSRFKEFESKLNEGSCLEWMEIIKSIYIKERDKQSGRKSISPRDRDISKEAKRLLFEEFSLSLGIPKDDVESFIINRVSNF